MKKHILSIILLLVLTLIPINQGTIVKAEEDETYLTLKTFEAENGDIITFDRSNLYNYRIVVNSSSAVSVDLRHLNWGTIKFLETSQDYLFYGSMMEGTEFRTQIPFMVKLRKDFSSHIIYFNDDAASPGYVYTVVEYPAGEFVAVELVEGDYTFGYYYGKYKLFSFDSSLNVISSIDCGNRDSSLSIAYDVIEVKQNDGKTFYFDKDFNMLDGYEKEINKEGFFEIYQDLDVNGVNSKIGTTFNIPGVYKLNDGIHDEVTINLEVKVEGIEDSATYNDYVSYKISGGSATLNGESVYLNGLITNTGNYNLEIKGIDGYTKNYRFTICPKLITEVEDGGTMYIGDEISFTGYARINDGEYITGSYDIKESGTYKLALYAEKSSEASSILYFSVPEIQIRNQDKTWVYIILSLSVIGMGIGIFLMIYSETKKKKIKESNN